MKRILILCLIVCFSLVGISGVASAATKAGDSTVFGTLSYDASTLDIESGPSLDISTFAAAVGVGRFFTDSFQAELALIGQTTTFDMGGSEDITQQSIGLEVRPNFHFNTAGNVVPYVGLTLGYLWYEFLFEGDSTGSFLYGGQAGIKQFVRDNAYIQYEIGYTATTFEIEDTDIDDGDLRVSIGMGFSF